MLIFLSFALLLALSIVIFVRQPKFGKLPAGERLQRIQRSSNYKDGQFRNIHLTPNLTEGSNMFTVMRKFFFGKGKNSKPAVVLPSQKTNILMLSPEENILVWFGHSSYFIQADGKKILVDPVFSGSASPLSFTTRSFPGSDVYTVEDFPGIDFLIISHDHWDHLDYQTILKLRPKLGRVITSLGVAEHLEYWGYDRNMIIEKDWDEKIDLGNGFLIHSVSARHFSGRTFNRNKSLWMSFVLYTPSFRLFLGGDSGYDTHFALIGNQFGPFDLAFLECGQYNQYWKYIHMTPEETVQAGIDLKAKKILPVHWSKFSLSLHDWDEPIKRFTIEAARKNIPVIHPMIGETVSLDHPAQPVKWWEKIV